MKTKLMMVTGLLALAFCLPNVSAQDEKKDKPKRKGPPSKEAILEKFDTNPKDGALSKDELAAMPEGMSTRLLAKWDKDKDGALSAEEVEAIKFPERKPPGDKPPKKKKEGDPAKKKEGKKKDKAPE